MIRRKKGRRRAMTDLSCMRLSGTPSFAAEAISELAPDAAADWSGVPIVRPGDDLLEQR
jgi:hypothetical protein